MHVLLVHNSYRLPGGEESAVRLTAERLRARGHAVSLYARNSGDWDDANVTARLGMAAETLFSRRTFSELTVEIDRLAPDVVHVHNIFPFVSPSVYYAAHRRRVPVVQTLHNFRFFCMNGLMFRDGRSCELCIGGNALHGAVHGCYQQSCLKSALTATTLLAHRAAGTWARKISAFIALSDFSRAKYIAAGFPGDRIRVVRNSVMGVSPAATTRPSSLSFLFLGRLSEEKGLPVLLAADSHYRAAGGRAPLVIAGDGSLMDLARRHQQAHPGAPIRIEGWVDDAGRSRLLEEASHLLFPTACYENCPYVVLESLAAGVPVIASRIGGVPELVQEGITGRLVTPGDPEALAVAMTSAQGDLAGWSEISQSCRSEAANRFGDERWISEIEAVYRSVVAGADLPSGQA